MILVIFPRKMKVFDTFGAKVIKWGRGLLLSDFGVKKIQKMQNDPLQLSTEENQCKINSTGIDPFQ